MLFLLLALVVTPVANADIRFYPGEALISHKKAEKSSFGRFQVRSGKIAARILSAGVGIKSFRNGDFFAMDARKQSGRAIRYRKNLSPCSLPRIQRVLRQCVDCVCEPNLQVSVSETTPNDPGVGNLDSILAPPRGSNMLSAWDVNTGSNSVVVAVVDTGILYTHPDLSANMWQNPNEIASNGIDDDHNGYIDDIYGINAITGSSDPLDDHGHGTHCAGTIGARGNNGLGLPGINWNVKLIGCKFINSAGLGSLDDAITCLNYLTDLKTSGINIKVANHSWGGEGTSVALTNAMNAAVEAGIVQAIAAGNSSRNLNLDSNPYIPAKIQGEGLITVGAMNHVFSDSLSNLAGFSNYGTNFVQIAAPGSSVYSTYLGNGYATMSGTSMATPHVAGAIALLAAQFPSYTPAQLESTLLGGAYLYGSISATIGGGRVMDVFSSISFGVPTATPTPSPTPTFTPSPNVPTATPTQAPTSTPVPSVTPDPDPSPDPSPDPGDPTDPGDDPGDATPVVESLEVVDASTLSKLSKMAPGQSGELDVLGTGLGSVTVSIMVNGKSCGLSTSASFEYGSYLNFSLPKAIGPKITSIGFESQSKSVKVSIKKAKLPKRSKALSVKQMCSKLKQSLG